MPRKVLPCDELNPDNTPFPWRCRSCGKQKVVPTTIRYETDARHENRNYAVAIPDLLAPVCSSCETMVYTDAVNLAVNVGLAQHLRLLSAEEISRAPKKLGIDQKRLAALLGISAGTFSRYVTGHLLPPRSVDLLLRVLLDVPGAREHVEQLVSGPSGG